MEETELKERLLETIQEYNNNMAAIKQLAFDAGGQTAVNRVDQEYAVLYNAYLQILKKELDNNNVLYKQLTDDANTEIVKLMTSVSQLNNINEIITLTLSVTRLVGKVIAML